MPKLIAGLFVAVLAVVLLSDTADARTRRGGAGWRGAHHHSSRGRCPADDYRCRWIGNRLRDYDWPGPYYGWGDKPYYFRGDSIDPGCDRIPVRVYENRRWYVVGVWRC